MSFVNQYRSTTVFGELKVQKYNTGNIAGLLDVSGNTILRGDCIINGNLSATDGTIDISGNLKVTGDISGNLIGNVTGTSTNVNVTDVSTNASFRVPFLSVATGSATISSDSGMNYNPSTETLNVTNINGTITNNSATSTIATDATDASFNVVFVSGTSGNLPLKVDTGIFYNPFSNLLTLDGDAKINSLTIGRGSSDVDTNTALGQITLENNTTGFENTAVGWAALEANTTGSSNTCVGYRASVANTSGNSNTGIGFEALSATTTGNSNVAVGQSSMTDNITGSSNVAVGADALDQNTGGSFNVAIGDGAGRINKTGNNNTFLGYNTDISGNVVYNNSTAIGTGAIIDASNCIVIGTASETVKIRGGLSVTGSITGTASNVNVSQVATDSSFRVPFLSATTGSATISSDAGITYNPSSNLLTTNVVGNLTGTAANVVASVATTGLFPIALATADTGSSAIKTDGSNLYYNALTKVLLTGELQADYMRTPLSGVWLINGNNTNSLSSLVPLFCSQTNLADINDQSALTLEAAVTAAGVTGTFVNPFNVTDTTDLIIIMPKWGIRGHADTGYAGATRINVHNQYDIPIYVSPSVDNSISSVRIYYDRVQITGQGS